MRARASHRRNARSLKALSLVYLALVCGALLLVHSASYGPAVSYVLLYLVVAVGATASVALLLLPAEQFTTGFSAGVYVFYAAFVSVATFLSGGVSSELHLLYFPLLLAAALHASWTIGVAALVSTLVGYLLTVTPDLAEGATVSGEPALVMFRMFVFALVGAGVLAVARSPAGVAKERAEEDQDGSSRLMERVSGELAARKGGQVAVVLVDPGRKVEDVELLLERVRGRVAEPILLGEGAVFGMVLSGVDDRAVESAARRALAAASSLGAEGTRAGAAVYPRDARTPGELLISAGQALESAFEVETSGAVVLAGKTAPFSESGYRAVP